MRKSEFLGVFCPILFVCSQLAFICRRETSIVVSSGREQGIVACCKWTYPDSEKGLCSIYVYTYCCLVTGEVVNIVGNSSSLNTARYVCRKKRTGKVFVFTALVRFTPQKMALKQVIWINVHAKYRTYLDDLHSYVWSQFMKLIKEFSESLIFLTTRM